MELKKEIYVIEIHKRREEKKNSQTCLISESEDKKYAKVLSHKRSKD